MNSAAPCAWAPIRADLADGSLAQQAYGATDISERHRHRYEFNREFEQVLTQHGLRLTGQTPDGVYVEICEVPDHPWYLGCQFHPEFKSKPLEPHPLFTSFLGAALQHRASKHEAAAPEAILQDAEEVFVSDAR